MEPLAIGDRNERLAYDFLYPPHIGTTPPPLTAASWVARIDP